MLRTAATSMPTNHINNLCSMFARNGMQVVRGESHINVVAAEGTVAAEAVLVARKGWTLNVNPNYIRVK